MYVKPETFFLAKPEQFTDFFFFFFSSSAPPSPWRKKIYVKSKVLADKELNWKQAHWFVEICQSLSGWLHICLRNNSYLYSARTVGQALAIWRRSASLRGFSVGIPNDSLTSHWEGGGILSTPLMRDRALIIFIQPWLGLRFRFPLLKSAGSLLTHARTHTHTHPFAGLCRQISVTAVTEAQSNKHSRTNLHGGKRGHWRWQQWRRIFLLTSFR